MGSPCIRVLLVEDNPGDARLIREMLAEARDTCFDLETVSRLAEGLERLRQDDCGVALLDLSLPDSQGLDTFRAFHARARGVPVVVLTGLADETIAVEAVHDGAQDYLVKGQVESQQLVHALRYAIGRQRRQQGMEATLRATEYELGMAREIQQRLFPATAPPAPGFDIHGAAFCAQATGGDFYDYLRLGDGRVGLVIGDVTSHGLGPALLMAATRAYLRAFAQTYADVGRILTLTNRVLVEDVTGGRNVTLLLAQLDYRARSFHYASAGHYPGYILDPRGNVRARLFSTGLPLGIMPDGTFATAPVTRLESGEIVVLFTDGLVEARRPDGEMFGDGRVLAHVRANRERVAQEIVGSLYKAVCRFAANGTLHDDVTLIVIKVGAAS